MYVIIQSYPLRTKYVKMSLPKPKTDSLKKRFAYRGAASWNKLHSDMIREVVECRLVNSLLRILNDYLYLYK